MKPQWSTERLFPLWLWERFLNRPPRSVSSRIAFMRRMDPGLLESIGRRKALMLFQRAARSVPAYEDFLRERGVDPRRVRTEEDFAALVPSTTKENYVQRYPLAARCIAGRLPDSGTLDESAGTCSSPTNWAHSAAEEDYYSGINRLSIPYLFNLHLEPLPVVFINGYALGAWAGGQRFASRMAALGLVKNTGPDVKKISCLLREIGAGFRYIIAGYPPFLKDLVDYLASCPGFAWGDRRIDFLTGGEGFSEAWRDYIRSRLGEKGSIYSIYGAIDLDVGIAMETPLTIALKRLLNDDRGLRVSLLGTDRVPCYVGQYSPANFLIKQVHGGDEKGEIEITVLNPRTASPKIRYNIRDEGGVVPFADLAGLLAELGRPFASLVAGTPNPPIAPLPFIYLFGRSDGTVFFNGAMISPLDIEKVFYARPALMSRLNGFKIGVETDDGPAVRLVIHLEMREGIPADEKMRMQVEGAIIAELRESNECLRHVLDRDPGRACPRFVFSPFKTGVFSLGDPSLKRRYILNS